MSRKTVLTLLAILSLCFIAFAACTDANNSKQKMSAPKEMDLESTQTTISVTYISYSECEVSLDNQNWISGRMFEGLEPGTEYTVYGRYAEDDRWAASDSISKKISTKKYVADDFDLPDYTQNQKTYTVINSENKFEFSLDNEVFNDNNVFVFTELGNKSIYVRTKETASAYAGNSKEIKVVVSVFERGDGSKAKPFEVSTREQFEQIGDYNKHFVLLNDIDFENKVYESNIAAFANLDGNGFTIKNIKIKGNAEYNGIFRQVGYLKNLFVEDAVMTIKSSELTARIIHMKAGVITGLFNGMQTQIGVAGVIENCKVVGRIDIDVDSDDDIGVMDIGGIAGMVMSNGQNGEILNCISDVAINVIGDYGATGRFGGIYGNSLYDCKITGSSSFGDITVTCLESRINSIGGLAGTATGGIYSSFADLDITVSGNKFEAWLGGLVGNGGDIENSYSLVNIVSTDGSTQYVGGLVGYVAVAEIRNCYAEGYVSVIQQYNSVYCGGLIGGTSLIASSASSLTNCFASVNIYAETTKDKYGSAPTPAVYIGRYEGVANPTHPLQVSNCFYDNDTALTGKHDGSSSSGQIYENLATGEMDYDTFLTLAWQNMLGWPSDIWLYEEGKLPQLAA